MIVRPEKQSEYAEIYALVKRAFETAKRSDGDEQDYVDRLRVGGGYLPELALVAEEDGQVIGHIMLTEIPVENGGKKANILLLAPLSVVPERQNEGIGSALVKEAMARAKKLGRPGVVLVGYPAYYNRFGFRQSSDFGIYGPDEIEAMYVQAAELSSNALAGVKGVLRIPL